MKKHILTFTVFILVFLILFFLIQSVFRYHWDLDNNGGVRPNNITGRNEAWKKEPEGTTDVLCIGTSEIFQAYSPIIAYEQRGITGFNYAMQTRSALSAYYELVYALKIHTPKIVICDFMALFDSVAVSDNDVNYRKLMDTIPDPSIRFRIAREIRSLDPKEKLSDWLIPLLHYHTGWDEIDESDFLTRTDSLNGYRDYTKGWDYKIPGKFSGEAVPADPALWDVPDDPLQPTDGSMVYYDRLIQECQKRQIRVVAVLPPKIKDAPVLRSHVKVMRDYFDSRGVDFLDYSSYEEVMRMGLSMDTDYSDEVHMNGIGAYKFTCALAEDLQERYGLSDRRSTPGEVRDAWEKAEKEYRTDFFESQKMLWGFLMCLSLYEDTPFVLQVYDKEILADERYGEALNKIGIKPEELTGDSPVILRDGKGNIICPDEIPSSDPYFAAYEKELSDVLQSGESDAEALEKAGIRCVTFYPDSCEICSDTAYDAEPEEDEYVDLFETVRRKLF